jgi:predicted NAD/FAD-dependent oxidoreductase
MNRLVAHLQSDLRVRFGSTVAAVERRQGDWHALDESGRTLEAAPRLILALPSPQAVRLLKPLRDVHPGAVDTTMIEAMESVDFESTWTFMVDGVDIDPGFDVMIDPDEDVRWLVREASRPGRSEAGAWTMHASPDWTKRHLDLDRSEVEPLLRDIASRLLQTPLPGGDAHRWRFSLVADPVGVDHLSTSDQSLLACGDWCLGGRVEHALESGIAAAGRILRNTGAARIDPAAGTLFGMPS